MCAYFSKLGFAHDSKFKHYSKQIICNLKTHTLQFAWILLFVFSNKLGILIVFLGDVWYWCAILKLEKLDLK